MRQQDDRDKLKILADANDQQSWADFGTCAPSHELLIPYITSFTYSVGCLKDRDAKVITRAYPTVMTQLYFEFCGDISEVKDSHGEFAFGARAGNRSTTIGKRTYIKQGLGGWFDIYQLPSKRDNRPIKNLKVDLYPYTLYRLFGHAPDELAAEDLQLADLIGATTSSLMLEEMEAAVTGMEMVAVVERYFLQHLLRAGTQRLIERDVEPKMPTHNETLGEQARRYNKSERWLQKRYAKVYGMSFKQMQNNLKFHQAHQVLSRAVNKREPVNLTTVAYHFGYFDQAHFIKDFKRYTGMTPGQYLRAQVGPQNQYLFYW